MVFDLKIPENGSHSEMFCNMFCNMSHIIHLKISEFISKAKYMMRTSDSINSAFESSKFGFSSHEEFLRHLAKFSEQLVNPRKFKME